MTDEVRTRVEKVLENQVLVGYEITDYSTFTDMGLDSLDKISVAMDLEDEFNFDIPDDDLLHIETFGDLVEYITKSLGHLNK